MTCIQNERTGMIYPFRISYQLVRQKILWSHCGAAIDKCLSHDLIDAVMINNFNLIFLHANKLWNGTETDLQASCAAKYRGNKAAKYNDLSFRIEHRYGRLTYWVCLINRQSGVHILKHLSFWLYSTLILLTLQNLECMPLKLFS